MILHHLQVQLESPSQFGHPNRSFAILGSLRKLEGLWVGHIKLFGRRQLELHLRSQL